MPRSFQTNLSSANKLIFDRKDGLFVQYQVETPATTYQKGQIVTLTANDTVEIAVAADFPFGYVAVANIPNDPSGAIHHADYVTVGTFGADAGFGFAKGGALAVGDLIVADGQNGTDADFMDYVVAGAGQYAVGICVEGGAATEQVKVLFFNSPVYNA